jgi:hypothetical protein
MVTQGTPNTGNVCAFCKPNNTQKPFIVKRTVELLIEQDLPVLQRAFEDEVVRLAEDDSNAPAPFGM